MSPRGWSAVALTLAVGMAPAVSSAAVSSAAVAPAAQSAAAPAGAPKVVLPTVRDVRLPNGTRLILAEKHDVPLIAFDGFLRGGGVTDPPGKEGIASLTAEMLRKGAGRRSARQIADAEDGVGASLASGAGMETAYISGQFMARDEALMLDLLRSILREPTFPDSEFTKLRDQTVEALRAQKDEPLAMLTQYASAFFYAEHPYGRPVSGDEATVASLTRADVLESYRANYGGDRLILAMVGDFDARAMEGKLKSAFGDWGRAAKPAPVIPPPARRSGRRVLLVDKPDAAQSYFWIGNLGVSRTDPDRVPLDVVNTAFGGRFTSMLNTALRIKSGLTYGARSRMSRLSLPGTVAIVSYTKLESTQKAIDLALETLDKLHLAGLNEATLGSATRYIAGQYPAGFETGGQIAGALVELASYGLPPTEVTEYPARVALVRRPEALKTLIERVYPSGKDLTIVVVGNAKVLRPVLQRYGTVVETSMEKPLLAAVRAVKTK